jgi:hypothetical protein
MDWLHSENGRWETGKTNIILWTEGNMELGRY